MGEKKNKEKSQEAKPHIMSGFVVWAISSSVFRLLYGGFGTSFVTVIAPLLVVGALSYIVGFKGGIGKSNAVDENR